MFGPLLFSVEFGMSIRTNLRLFRPLCFSVLTGYSIRTKWVTTKMNKTNNTENNRTNNTGMCILLTITIYLLVVAHFDYILHQPAVI